MHISISLQYVCFCCDRFEGYKKKDEVFYFYLNGNVEYTEMGLFCYKNQNLKRQLVSCWKIRWLIFMWYILLRYRYLLLCNKIETCLKCSCVLARMKEKTLATKNVWIITFWNLIKTCTRAIFCFVTQIQNALNSLNLNFRNIFFALYRIIHSFKNIFICVKLVKV